MPSDNHRPFHPDDQTAGVSHKLPLGVQLAGAAAFVLWRGYYFFTVVIIPALGWR